MDKSLPVKPAKAPARQTSPVALFAAQYEFLRRFHSTGFITRQSIYLGDNEWSVDMDDKNIYVMVKYDLVMAQSRASEWSRIGAEMAFQEREAGYVRDTLAKLESSIKAVEGKRSLISKIDQAKQPDIYAAEVRELGKLESALGDYQPFLDNYKALLEECERKVKEYKDSLDALPTIREPESFVFSIEEIAKIVQ